MSPQPQTIKCSFGLDKLPVDLIRLSVATEHYASYQTFMEWRDRGLRIYEMGRRISFVSIKETEQFIRTNAKNNDRHLAEEVARG